MEKDLLNCLLKSGVFAITVTWIAIFNGYDAVPTSTGISQATTRTVGTFVIGGVGIRFYANSTDVWELMRCKRRKVKSGLGIYADCAVRYGVYLPTDSEY